MVSRRHFVVTLAPLAFSVYTSSFPSSFHPTLPLRFRKRSFRHPTNIPLTRGPPIPWAPLSSLEDWGCTHKEEKRRSTREKHIPFTTGGDRLSGGILFRPTPICIYILAITPRGSRHIHDAHSLPLSRTLHFILPSLIGVEQDERVLQREGSGG
jgi:hypothetical protein